MFSQKRLFSSGYHDVMATGHCSACRSAVNFLYMGSFHHVMAVQIAGVSSSFGTGQLDAAV